MKKENHGQSTERPSPQVTECFLAARGLFVTREVSASSAELYARCQWTNGYDDEW